MIPLAAAVVIATAFLPSAPAAAAPTPDPAPSAPAVAPDPVPAAEPAVGTEQLGGGAAPTGGDGRANGDEVGTDAAPRLGAGTGAGPRGGAGTPGGTGGDGAPRGEAGTGAAEAGAAAPGTAADDGGPRRSDRGAARRAGGPFAALPSIAPPASAGGDRDFAPLAAGAGALLVLVLASGCFLALATRAGRLGDS